MNFAVAYLILALRLVHALVRASGNSNGCMNVVCYYDNEAYFRKEPARMTPEDIHPSVCTHIHFYRALVSGGKIQAANSEDRDVEYSKGLYARVTSLKSMKPDLKVLLTIEGYSSPTKDFEDIVKTDNSMRLFSDEVILYLREYNFDGVDLAWYFNSKENSVSLTLLVEILREAFFAEAKRVDRPRLMVSVSVEGSISATKLAHRKERLLKHADYIIINTKDYHGPWESKTGLNSPIYPQQQGDQACIQWTIEQWTSPGADRQKLFMTVSPRGSVFTLTSLNETNIGAPSTAGRQGHYTNEIGFLAYFEICQVRTEQKSSFQTTVKQGGAYFVFNGNQWVGYDNHVTILQKLQLAKHYHLGGVAVNSIDWDDARGQFCKQGAFPLTRLANACSVMLLDTFTVNNDCLK